MFEMLFGKRTRKVEGVAFQMSTHHSASLEVDAASRIHLRTTEGDDSVKVSIRNGVTYSEITVPLDLLIGALMELEDRKEDALF